MKPLLSVVLLAAFALAACDASPQLSAALRFHAAKAYADIAARCERQGLTDKRRTTLQPLFNAFHAVEQGTHGKSAEIDFALAKQDAEFARPGGTALRCGFHGFPDSEIDFELEKERLTDTIGSVRSLSRMSQTSALMPDWVTAKNGGPFRAATREILLGLDPQCPYTEEQHGITALSSARRSMWQLELQLAGSPYADHMAVAKADVQFLNSVILVECSEPDSGEDGRIKLRKLDADIVKAINGLATIAGISRERP